MPSAFSLIEVIVVVVLLGVIAGLAVPRLAGNESREQRERVRAIANLMSEAAFRHQVSGVTVSLRYEKDEEEGEIAFEELRSIDAEEVLPEREWQDARLANPATIEGLDIIAVIIEGIEQDEDDWRIAFVAGQSRQDVEIELAPEGEEQTRWVVELIPGESTARVRSPDEDRLDERDRVIDLDAEGIGDQAW